MAADDPEINQTGAIPDPSPSSSGQPERSSEEALPAGGGPPDDDAKNGGPTELTVEASDSTQLGPSEPPTISVTEISIAPDLRPSSSEIKAVNPDSESETTEVSIQSETGVALTEVEGGSHELQSVDIGSLGGTESNDPLIEAAIEKILSTASSTTLDQTVREKLLHSAAQSGHIELLKVLLEDPRIEVNAQEGYLGCTALILACWKGHTEAVRLLLLNGADVLNSTRDGLTCLHVAAFCGHTEIVNLLLHGKSHREYWEEADPSPSLPVLSSKRCWALIDRKTSIERFSALHMAASGEHDQEVPIAASMLEALRTSLLDFYGLASNPKATYDIQNQLWLDYLFKIRQELHVNDGNSFQRLLENLAAYGNDGGGSALQKKVGAHEYEGLVRSYVELISFSNTRDKMGRTALHYAAWKGKDTLVKFLMWENLQQANPLESQLGTVVNINVADVDGHTPLHLASRNCSTKVVLELLGSKTCVEVNYRPLRKGKSKVESYRPERSLQGLFAILAKSTWSQYLLDELVDVRVASEVERFGHKDLLDLLATSSWVEGSFDLFREMTWPPSLLIPLYLLAERFGLELDHLAGTSRPEDLLHLVDLSARRSKIEDLFDLLSKKSFEVVAVRSLEQFFEKENYIEPNSATNPTGRSQRILKAILKALKKLVDGRDERPIPLLRPDMAMCIWSEDRVGITPLHYAVERENADVVGLLITQRKTDVFRQARNGQSPWSIAFPVSWTDPHAILSEIQLSLKGDVTAQFWTRLSISEENQRSLRKMHQGKLLRQARALALAAENRNLGSWFNLQALEKQLFLSFETALVHDYRYDIEDSLGVKVSACHYRNMNLLHVGAYYGCGQELEALLALKTYKRLVNEYSTLTSMHQTPLHFAINGGPDAVAALLKEETLNLTNTYRYTSKPEYEVTTEDTTGTLLDLVKLKFGHAVDSLGLNQELWVRLQENTTKLLAKPDYYQNRQVYVDGANAILVGAALIASVTFAGFLQPPLGYVQYYMEFFPFPAPPSTPESFAAVGQHEMVLVFWVFNSLSFFFAIATVLAGAGAVLPSSAKSVEEEVTSVRRWLQITATLLTMSIVCVLGAFTAAGSASLPNIAKYQFNFVWTAAFGLGLCLATLFAFCYRLIVSLTAIKTVFITGILVSLEASIILYFLCRHLFHRIANDIANLNSTPGYLCASSTYNSCSSMLTFSIAQEMQIRKMGNCGF